MKHAITFESAARVGFLVLFFSILISPLAIGSDTGWHLPQNDSIAPGSSWVNRNNVLTCNGSNAYYMGLNTEDTLFTSNYGFSLPSNAIIDSLWYRYSGFGAGDGEEFIIRIGFIAGPNRGYGSVFYLSGDARADSAHLVNFDHGIINITAANLSSFGLYAVTNGDEFLTDTNLDCVAIKIFYHELSASSRRQKTINMEDFR